MTIQLPAHLVQEIAGGRGVLVLGAGASVTSRNRSKKEIKLSEPLAREIAAAAGLEYEGEGLSEVIEAAHHILGDARMKAALEANYLNCTPSKELEALCNVTWRRIYTFNIDDTLRNISNRAKSQTLKYFNALVDRREDPQSYSECQVIYLHGFVGQFSSGFVFSESDYARQASRRHPWYERLGEDFHDYTVIFVGAKLDEPLLFQHIKAVLSVHDLAGMSYLITPDSISSVRAKSLENRDIQHLQGTLADFVSALKGAFPDGLRPNAIQTPALAGTVIGDESYTKRDIEALRNFFPVSKEVLQRRFKNQLENRRLTRSFYEGYGPSWPVIVGSSFAKLRQFTEIQKLVISWSNEASRMLVVLGESGSGKSTCVMHSALETAESRRTGPIFEYREQSGTLIEAFRALQKYVGNNDCIVLIDDLHIYADELSDIVEEQQFSFVKIISSARLSDWRSRISSQFPTATTVTLKRFSDDDIDEIISKVLEHLPVPAFKKLPPAERRARFQRSKKQLLIALKEATESRGFNEIIDDEFGAVQEADARALFYIVGVPTIARSGILESAAETIYNSSGRSIQFSESLRNYLSGMIDLGNSGRLVARHEIYARHVIDNGDYWEIVSVLRAILDYFTRFEAPVIRRVVKLDGQIFKFVLNNKFIYDFFSKHHDADAAVDFLEEFSLKLQLDGHFWLQYGLLLRRLGRQQEAFDRLLKSVQAFPENSMAQHALAQQKLIAAGGAKKFDEPIRRLMDEAVKYLLDRHYHGSGLRVRGPDEYPLVTLSNYHIDALLRHNQKSEAVRQAKKYFRMIQEMEKTRSDEHLSAAKGKLLTFTVTGAWEPLKYKRGEISYIE